MTENALQSLMTSEASAKQLGCVGARIPKASDKHEERLRFGVWVKSRCAPTLGGRKRFPVFISLELLVEVLEKTGGGGQVRMCRRGMWMISHNISISTTKGLCGGAIPRGGQTQTK